MGSMTLTERMAPCTLTWASALFLRATSSSRLFLSSPSLTSIWVRPDLSWSTTWRCEAIIGSAAFASFSALICLVSAILASESHFSPPAASPADRSWSAFCEAARALPPQSRASATSASWSFSARRRFPMVWATASCASAIEEV